MHSHLAALLALRFVTAATAGGDDPLSKRADLPSLVARALEHNPDLAADRERVRAADLEAKAAGGFPDLALRYQLWNAPLERPYDAQMHMLGLEQEFPAYGVRGARERAGKAAARALGLQERARALDVVAQVRKACAELLRAQRERRIREEHVRLAQRIVELARANYQAGRVSQQDVLRAGVELSRLQADFAGLDQASASATALVNALVGRPVDAALGELADLPLPPEETEAAAPDLEGRLQARPEIASLDAAVERSRAQVEAATRSGRWPAFMVGVDYMYSPMGMPSQHGWSAMVSASLPWLNPRHGEEVAAAERALSADQRAKEAALVGARFQVRDALARYRAARETFALLDRELLPQARQSYEAAETAFASNQGDALGLLDSERSLLQVRVDRERSLALVHMAWADVERALGAGAAPQSQEATALPTKKVRTGAPSESRAVASVPAEPGAASVPPDSGAVPSASVPSVPSVASVPSVPSVPSVSSVSSVPSGCASAHCRTAADAPRRPSLPSPENADHGLHAP